MADETENPDKLDAVLERLAVVSTQLADATKPKDEPRKDEPPKVYTREELDAAVEDGKITRATADQIIDKQIEDRAAERAARKVRSEELLKTLDAKIGEFEAVVPDLADKNSDAFKKVAAEYNRMLSLGSPSTKATELLALERVFGTPERAKGGGRHLDSHAESFGGGSPAPRKPGGKENENEAPSDLTAREKQHYQHQIDRGVMSGWKQVREERKHRRASVRAA
jgi:hypothetical protein